MPPDRERPHHPLERFIARVKKHHTVYGLRSPDDESWAVCASREDEDLDVVLIWSNPDFATEHRREEWDDYIVTPISAEDFVETWLQGMHAEGSFVGPDWDLKLSGPEIPAVEMAERLSND